MPPPPLERGESGVTVKSLAAILAAFDTFYSRPQSVAVALNSFPPIQKNTPPSETA